MVTTDQVLLHLVGDYVMQSQWMADNKAKRAWPCICHVIVYTLPFLLLTTSIPALVFILSTHFLIDRFRLARYVNWVKNHMAPFVRLNLNPHDRKTYLTLTKWRPFPPFKECQQTGYHDQTLEPHPVWMRVWLFIIVDNILHLILNSFAIRYL